MKKVFLAMVAVICMCVGLTASARAEGLKEGQWSMTMNTKMDSMSPEMAAHMKQMESMPPEAQAMMKKMGVSMNMDGGGGMTVTTTQCITKKNPVPNHMKKQEHCQQTHDMHGNTVDFHVNCKDKDMEMESMGSMTYAGDTMEGHIKSHQVHSGRPMDSSIDIKGKYLGPCKESK